MIWVFGEILRGATVTYVLTGRAEPFAIGDDHERRPQTGRVVAAVAPITQQDLQRAEKLPNERSPSETHTGPHAGAPTSSG